MKTVPSDLLERYRENFKAFGHDEAVRQLRMSIVSRLGHAWFQQHRVKIEAEVRAVDERCKTAEVKNG